MNIAFDAAAILGPMSKNRGIGNYALSQFKEMILMDKQNEYYFLNMLEPFSLFDKPPDNLHEYYFFCGNDRFLLEDIQYANVFGDIIQNFIQEHKIDIFYITSPFDDKIPLYRRKWFEGTKVVATVYDIIPYVMKDHYLKSEFIRKRYMERVEMLRFADRYLVISQSVKDDMVNYLQFDEDKIKVIYGAADRRFQTKAIPPEQKAALLSKYNIKNEYLICTGGDDKRKNIDRLIAAFAMLPKELIEKHQLVVVCRLSPPSEERLTNLINKHRLKGRVILTNFVKDEELLCLYNLAKLLVFPSQYEGFGLPVVEAWACGIPVVTSNNSSLGEIAGDAAVLIDPFDTEDMARGMTRALQETDLQELAAKGRERLKMYQWENVAKLSIDAINSLDIARKKSGGKSMRIAFFTPLPPVQSGISDYSVDILNALSEYFEIDVFIDKGYQPKCELDENIKVFSHNKFNARQYDRIVYQMGNSEYHIYMYPYIKKHGGTVVLHDYNLHLITSHYTLTVKGDMDLYKEYLLEDYPKEKVNAYLNDLKKGNIGVKAYEMPLNGYISNYADKIIVHSIESKEKLLNRNIQRNVSHILHYANIEPLPDAAEAKRKLGIPDGMSVLASFGHIQQTKRAMPTLQAFKRICEKYENVVYYFVGAPDKVIKEPMQQYIKENALEERVNITGYTELDAFLQYIDATDICVNLRYPYNGETSGSLMRILAKGKCVVVNDIGSFGEIPDEACVKIPSAADLSEQAEIEQIYAAFDRLLGDKQYKSELEASARRYAEENLDLKIIAKQYAEAIENKHTPALDEVLLKNIAGRIAKQSYTYAQVNELACTLGYSKNYKTEICPKTNNISVADIMAEIKYNIRQKR